jgi:hypothetical protein
LRYRANKFHRPVIGRTCRAGRALPRRLLRISRRSAWPRHAADGGTAARPSRPSIGRGVGFWGVAPRPSRSGLPLRTRLPEIHSTAAPRPAGSPWMRVSATRCKQPPRLCYRIHGGLGAVAAPASIGPTGASRIRRRRPCIRHEQRLSQRSRNERHENLPGRCQSRARIY